MPFYFFIFSSLSPPFSPFMPLLFYVHLCFEKPNVALRTKMTACHDFVEWLHFMNSVGMIMLTEHTQWNKKWICPAKWKLTSKSGRQWRVVSGWTSRVRWSNILLRKDQEAIKSVFWYRFWHNRMCARMDHTTFHVTRFLTIFSSRYNILLFYHLLTIRNSWLISRQYIFSQNSLLPHIETTKHRS